MDIFSQKKSLIRIIIILALLNVFSIGVFFWKECFHKPPPPRDAKEKKDVSDVLKKELKLNDSQCKQIKELRTSFFDKEKLLAEAIRAERDSMNVAMFNKTINDTLIKSLARRIADNDYKMEMMRFEQARDFKKICTTEQLEKFENLVLEIRDYFKPENNADKKK